jgi:2'-5' RNA ligase
LFQLKNAEAMSTTATTLPGYRFYEYLLVLAPHEELRERIAKLKEEFSETYKAPAARGTKPHITLATFLTWGMMEEKILQRLQHISLGVRPFKVELKDYGSYPTHSIFINVTTKVPIQNLIKELKEAQRLLKSVNEHKPHFMEEPHVPVARKLKPWQYESGWLEYSHRQFTGRFIADGMLLLKRAAGEKGAYQVVRRFEFLDLPVATRQGSLFV